MPPKRKHERLAEHYDAEDRKKQRNKGKQAVVDFYKADAKKKQAASEARKKAKLEQPLQTPPTNFSADQQTFPAIYGVDGAERRRQKVISKIVGH